jgi:hypothetical protein
MTEGVWLAKVVCPHGLTCTVPFDDLGYLTKPADSACEKHQTVAAQEDRTLPRRPGWFAIWRATRKARRTLRDL